MTSRTKLLVSAMAVVVGLIAIGITYRHMMSKPSYSIGQFVDCLNSLGKADRLEDDDRMVDNIVRDYGETREDALALVSKSEGCPPPSR